MCIQEEDNREQGWSIGHWRGFPLHVPSTRLLARHRLAISLDRFSVATALQFSANTSQLVKGQQEAGESIADAQEETAKAHVFIAFLTTVTQYPMPAN